MRETNTKSMLEKLKEDYERSVKQGNKGHAIGFYNELNEIIKEVYEFENKRLGKGKFTLKSKQDNFFWWDYDAKNKGKNERPRFYKRV